MRLLPEVVVSSLAPASLYALLGVGFVIIYRATRVINFVQGQMAYIGALIFITGYQHLDHQFFLAASVAIGAALLIGAIINLALMSPLDGQGPLILIMVTLVLGTAILNGAIA